MPSALQSKPIFATLDAIRGVAAVLVMMRHVPYFSAISFQESYLAVDVFFLLSGVVIAHAYEQRLQQGLSVLHFVVMRVVRIYPLYLLGSAIALMAMYRTGMPDWGTLLSILGLGGLLLPRLSGNLLFPLDHPAWSLFFELLANLFYAALVRRLSVRRLWLLLAVSALGLGLVLGGRAPHNLDLGWTRATLIGGVFRVGYSFFAGVLLYRLQRRYGSRIANRLGRSNWARNGLPWLLVAAVSAVLMASPAPAWRPWFDFAAATAGFPALIYLALCLPPGGLGAGLARWLGLVSYPIYALHVPLSWLFGPFLEQVFKDDRWLGASFAAILLPLCWLLGLSFDAPLRRRLLAYAEAGFSGRWRRPILDDSGSPRP